MIWWKQQDGNEGGANAKQHSGRCATDTGEASLGGKVHFDARLSGAFAQPNRTDRHFEPRMRPPVYWTVIETPASRASSALKQ